MADWLAVLALVYAFGFVVGLMVGLCIMVGTNYDIDDPMLWEARYFACLPIWPLALTVLFVWAYAKLLRYAMKGNKNG